MSIIAKVLNKIKPSASNAATQIALDMKSKGKNIISLSYGEPDFDTPEHIKLAAFQAMKRGETKYPPIAGIKKLREAVSKKFYIDNNLKYNDEQIIISNGAKQVIFNALISTINKNDEVIIPAPYWVSYPEMVTLCGGKPVIITSKAENNFKINAKDLEKAITPKTKWFIFNSPSNPSGSVYKYEEMLALSKILLKYDHVWIIEDDIYEKIIYDKIKFYTFPQVQPNLIKRTLIVNGLSKSYAMTGWRVGYGAGPKNIIKAMETVQSQTTSGVSTISQWAGIAALKDESNCFIKTLCDNFLARRNYVVSAINDIDGLYCNLPQGAFYIYPSCYGLLNRRISEKIIKNDKDFTNLLLHHEGVSLINGSAFGLSMHFRLSYASSMENLKEACSRIKNFCYNLK